MSYSFSAVVIGPGSHGTAGPDAASNELQLLSCSNMYKNEMNDSDHKASNELQLLSCSNLLLFRDLLSVTESGFK